MAIGNILSSKELNSVISHIYSRSNCRLWYAKMSKDSLTGNDDSNTSNIGRRGFLSISSIAAFSATGYAVGTVEAASLTADDLGYGMQSYGAYGYGGVETTQ